MSCGACVKGECPTPEACELPVAIATKPPRVAFLLEGAFERWPRGTPAVLLTLLLALLGFAGQLDLLAHESVEIHAEGEETDQ